MALPQNLQGYLEHHKIGALFEELMGKVVSDMPEDPCTFLIRALERKVSRRATHKSYGQESRSKERRQQQLVTATPATKPSRSGPTQSATAKEVTKAEWKSQTLKPGSTFDDLWGSTDTSSKGKTTKKVSVARSTPDRPYAFSNELGNDQEFLYVNNGYEGPRRNRNKEPLSDELSLQKDESNSPVEAGVLGKLSSGQKLKQTKRNAFAQNIQNLHKKSGGRNEEWLALEDENDAAIERGVELAENLEDLRREGVKKGNYTRSNAVRTRRLNNDYEVKPKVVVSICARCANALTHQPSVGAKVEEVKMRPESQQSAVRFSPSVVSDEEFESVSQVTGPRQPVWQEDSDSENTTPRKGQHMFGSSSPPMSREQSYEHKAVAFTPTPSKSVNGTSRPSTSSNHNYDEQDQVTDFPGDGESPWRMATTEVDTTVSSFYDNGKMDRSGPY